MFGTTISHYKVLEMIGQGGIVCHSGFVDKVILITEPCEPNAQ